CDGSRAVICSAWFWLLKMYSKSPTRPSRPKSTRVPSDSLAGAGSVAAVFFAWAPGRGPLAAAGVMARRGAGGHAQRRGGEGGRGSDGAAEQRDVDLAGIFLGARDAREAQKRHAIAEAEPQRGQKLDGDAGRELDQQRRQAVDGAHPRGVDVVELAAGRARRIG